jgi:hypothetical protein
MTVERGDLFVVLEDRGEAGAVMVLVLADDKMPPQYDGLPTLVATFDEADGCYRPGTRPRRATAKAGPTETKAAGQ